MGGLAGLGAVHPHFGHAATADGCFSPHSMQNLPVLTVPHFGQVHPAAASGFFAPHSVQNLPLAGLPQFGHVHEFCAADTLAAGDGAACACCCPAI